LSFAPAALEHTRKRALPGSTVLREEIADKAVHEQSQPASRMPARNKPPIHMQAGKQLEHGNC
jgi:hypothetical protein